MYKLVDVVADNMKDFYPYLLEKSEFVAKLVKNEEEAFPSDAGQQSEKLLNEELAKAEAAKGVIFIVDTYGFRWKFQRKKSPASAVISIDEEGFEAQMRQRREPARAAEDAQSMASQSADLMDFTAPFEFTGYETMSDTGTVPPDCLKTACASRYWKTRARSSSTVPASTPKAADRWPTAARCAATKRIAKCSTSRKRRTSSLCIM